MPRIKRQVHLPEACDCEECSDRRLIATSNTQDNLSVQDVSPLASIIIVLEDFIPTNPSEIDQSRILNINRIVREGCNGLCVAINDKSNTPISHQLLHLHKETPLGEKYKKMHVSVFTDDENLVQGSHKKDFHCERVIDMEAMEGSATKVAQYVLQQVGIEKPSPPHINSNTNGLSSSSNGNGTKLDTITLDRNDLSTDVAVVVLKNRTIDAQWFDSFTETLLNNNFVEKKVILSLVLGLKPSELNKELIPGHKDQPVLQFIAGREGQEGDEALAVLTKNSILRPKQSFQYSGMDQVSVDAFKPALIVHRLPEVIRQDFVEKLDAAETTKQGAGGCILAEHVIAELAFKLQLAPKYGA